MELILGLIILALLARVCRSNKGNYFSTIDDHKSLVEKWTPILDFGIYDPSGVLTSPPISERDKPMVAILFEQSERYCMKNKIHKNSFLSEIRHNYKTTTYNFN